MNKNICTGVEIKMATYSHLIVVIGILGLAHAAFSAAQHRSYIRLTEQEFSRLPADIVLECLLSLMVTCYGVINMAGKFRGIRAMAEFQNKSMDTVGNRPSFYSFAHRGIRLYADEPETER